MKKRRFTSRKSKKTLYGLVLLFGDLIFLSAAFFLAFYLRFYSDPTIEQFYRDYIAYSALAIIIIIIIFYFTRLYSWDYRYRGSGQNTKLFLGMTAGIALMVIIGYTIQTYSFSRLWVGYFYLFSIVFITIFRFLNDKFFYMSIKRSRNFSRTLIIGAGEDANRIRKTFNDDLYNDMEVVGIIDKKEIIDREKENLGDYRIVGYLENIKDTIMENKIHTLVISGRQYQYYEILDIIEALKGMDVLIMMFPGFFEFSINRMESREVSGIPLLHIANIGFFGHSLFIKNLFDYVLGFIFFMVFIPIYLIVALMIKIDSRGPVFYRQKRITKDGREFLMYKFRTMIVDADKMLDKLKEENEADGLLFKIKKDPRITRAGKFLRRFSIDELPQIINVLKGELSLIGPRPPLPVEVGEYKKWHRKRLNVKQGITGLWQVAGRSELGFEEGIKLDLYYIQNWSIGMDIKILLKTIPAIISRRGAY